MSTTAVVYGNLGKNAETKDVGSTTVTSFSVASSKKMKGKEITTWINCNLWGKRGKALEQYLGKGQKVQVSGQLYQEEYNDKYYLKLDVDNVVLIGKAKAQDEPSQATTTDDDVPF